ncbi:MAG: hypothetical protein A3F83_16225 [Candidatus Glassbacteria bacterium RIFCSPLOWO2_12_FULL_58_11]|uniref:Uncharacterized protein n=1 Tax=Candidatus Glassbacteria bacterium RIFCSPLOWO2_12_FULL_58_11 TaxID=1817867 RepID=A0A1F5Z2Y8_9BACT|nr:MAG: hypothetical protein A3F83_16225 [Candidatus Glassbacteria bacterium RIFCSPLOWO2_12_FULL_58_11]
MLIFIAKATLILICFAALTGFRCQNSLLDPQPAAMEDLSPGVAVVLEDAGNNSRDYSDCLLPVDRQDSTLVLDILNDREHSIWVWDNITRIEYRVTLGLVENGMTLADTSGSVSLENKLDSIRVMLKLGGPVPAGKNQVAINSVLRYLDGFGHLALPIRQTGFYCYLQW